MDVIAIIVTLLIFTLSFLCAFRTDTHVTKDFEVAFHEGALEDIELH